MTTETAPQKLPKRRRVPGVPNLYQRPADDRYEGGFTGADGKWHIKTLAARTEKGAARELRALLVKRDEGQDVSPSRMTLNDVADLYFEHFESLVARGERTEGTLTLYRGRYDLHVRPTLGRRAIQQVRRQDASRWLSELRTKPTAPNGKATKKLLSDHSIRGILIVAGVVCRYAVKQGLAADNPMSGLEGEKPPAKNQTKARILSVDDVKLLLESAPANYRALLATAVFSGMRQSELLGLRWCDVDFTKSVIHVRHQLSRASRTQPAKLLSLKTDAAERTIELAPPLASVLREHKLASSHSGDGDFCFCSEIGTPLYYRNVARRGLDKAADAAGLNDGEKQRLSFHDLRHTAVTHLIRSNADVAQVQRFAGHSKPSVTLDLYVGEFEGRQQNEAGSRLGALYADVLPAVRELESV